MHDDKAWDYAYLAAEGRQRVTRWLLIGGLVVLLLLSVWWLS